MPTSVATPCICIVFVPVFALSGTARYLFVPLAEAVVFAVLASCIVSMTLVPTMVMWLYRHGEDQGHATDARRVTLWLRPFVAVHAGFERAFGRFRDGYRWWPGIVLHHRLAVALLFVAFHAGMGRAALRNALSSGVIVARPSIWSKGTPSNQKNDVASANGRKTSCPK